MKHTAFLLFFTCNLFSVWAQDARSNGSPQIIVDPARYYHYSEHSRKFTGIPSIAVTEGGILWATWYAGLTPGENADNYVVLARSDDGGKTWTEKLVVDPDGRGPLRAFDPEIWIAPDSRLWFFWSQKEGVISGTAPQLWAMVIENPDLPDSLYPTPAKIADGVMMCKPITLSNGDWLLPVSTWRQNENSARVVVSKDEGRNWQVRGACDIPKADREFDEHMVVERKDKSLWMLVRTKYGIGESFSYDQGQTWTALKPSTMKHPSARFFISRLASGNLLMVKHGPMQYRTGRSHLMAFISEDDGLNWSKGLLLDERPGISYPDGQQASNGRIFVTYDYNRTTDQRILLTHFTEEDVLDEDFDFRIIKVFNNRSTISKGGND